MAAHSVTPTVRQHALQRPRKAFGRPGSRTMAPEAETGILGLPGDFWRGADARWAGQSARAPSRWRPRRRPAARPGLAVVEPDPAPVGEQQAGRGEARRMIEAYFPALPKIELFACGKARPGWTAWGNESA